MLKRRSILLAILTVLFALVSSFTAAQDSNNALPTTTGTITVTSLADSGAGSLRQAIADAEPDNAINFGLSGTISLESALIITGKSITIDGTGQNITLSGEHKATVIGIEEDAALTLNALTIADGDAFQYGDAGGIHNMGILNVWNTTFSNNFGHDNGSGGAIANLPDAATNIFNSTFSGNSAGQAGAIFNDEGTLNVSNSTFSGNFTTTDDGTGGAILNRGGTTNVSSSTFSDNASQVAGAALANDEGMGGTLNVKNSIITRSSMDSCNAVLATSSDNLIDDVSCGGTLGKVTHLSTTLALATSTVKTQTFALSSGSNAIDGVEDCTDFSDEAIMTDQSGTARPQGTACDVGAFELES